MQYTELAVPWNDIHMIIGPEAPVCLSDDGVVEQTVDSKGFFFFICWWVSVTQLNNQVTVTGNCILHQSKPSLLCGWGRVNLIHTVCTWSVSSNWTS